MKLQQSAAQYLMSFLVENFTDLADLQCYVPPMESIHPPQKSEVVPMKILFKDEKLKNDILTQLMEDSNIDGTPQVCTYSNRHLKQYIVIDITHMYTCIHTCTHIHEHTTKKVDNWRPTNVQSHQRL